ncbi:CDK5 regulatory subunit-associated protein 2 isoform X3 [Oryzias melastigma]|uniref:CDK5 regulatory subunit-associated protein 2 isoform X3 n=1 Tax=Oryzias melastigma TaxID=30732 RepID=UPI000CF82470|nr:CDK5 regulatory subunit-associated protein 2 isoform X3 [Oryzias melastigma]
MSISPSYCRLFCRLPDSINPGEFSTGSMTAPSIPEKMSPIKALTMKDYENQITALKKENFNLKLRIYFMEERMQQKCDDSTEDIFKTNIELKVELESMKRELAEKQELLVSASKALESLAGRESGEPQRVREQAQREMDMLRELMNKRITDLEQNLQAAEEEIEKMAAIAEQEKLRNINMEKQLQAFSPLSAFPPVPSPTLAQELQQALQEKENIIEQLKIMLKNQEAALHHNNGRDRQTDSPSSERFSDLIMKKDHEIQALRDELQREKGTMQPEQQKSDVNRLESVNKMLNEDLSLVKSTNESLTKKLEDFQNQNKILSGKLEEMENEVNSDKKNALKRDKTIQGLTQVLREKEKEIAELCHEIEDRDDALAKAREAAHKAQLQKYQGVEEHQNLLMEKQTELAQLQGEHHAKVLEAQKLQRALDRKEQELSDLQQLKDQLETELEDARQQKKKGDKALNDLNNQLKKLNGEMGERESALEQQYQDALDQTKRKLQAHEVTIQRLTSSLADKEQQLQEYINMVKNFDESKSPSSNEGALAKLRQRLKEKESALERALDEKFAAVEEKDNEIHKLHLTLREKERDLDRLNNLLAHNEETINNFDSLIKEKDVELQHLANTLKNLQRAKQDVEDNLNRSLREKDAIIKQLQLSLEGKTKDMDELAESMLSQSQSQSRDLAEQMGQRLKVTEAMLAEAVKAREALVADNESAVEGLLATIRSKDQLLKESAEHFNRMLSERTQEIQALRKQLADKQLQLTTAERQSSSTAQETYLETAELRTLLAEKDSLIDKLLQRGQDRDQFLAQMSQKTEHDHVLELKQTIQIMQEKLDGREAELSRRNSAENQEGVPLSKKTVALKKELAQKTEALNNALKRENELKMSLAELQTVLSELEARSVGQSANIDFLTATLKTKEEIINVFHQRLGPGGDSQVAFTQEHVISSGMERSLPELPQRERTIIGGDRLQESLPGLTALQQEHDALNKALRAEQQLYSSLIRTVKEHDSAQRLHALQLELTAVQLLRQRLEDGIKANEELRDDLEKELHRAKMKEGMDLVDPKELESMRHQLEDAQRWNASLQARLGAIQNRGGGVGGATDCGDTLSFVGDQTSYMSICVGEGSDDDGFSQLSAQELRQKVLELQESVSRLQALNDDLQSRLTKNAVPDKNGDDLTGGSLWKQQPQMIHEMQLPAPRMHFSDQDENALTGTTPEEVASEGCVRTEVMSREHTHSNTKENDFEERNGDLVALKSLLKDCGSHSVSHLREELLHLRSDNAKLRGLLKEHKSTESKEKESRDASGNSSDGPADLRKSLETLEALGCKTEGGISLSAEVTAQKMENPIPELQKKTPKQRHRAGVKSRLPVPVKLRAGTSCSSQTVNSEQQETDTQQPNLDDVFGQETLTAPDSPSALHQNTSPSSTLQWTRPSCSSSESHGDSETRGHAHSDSTLLTQLELLHQECQEKEVLINKLNEQLADWEELHAQLQEKERLNQQYTSALQAAQSTIAYLTACSLDSQPGFGSASDFDASLQKRCMELQQAVQEKEELNNQLMELLEMKEKASSSSPHSEDKTGKSSRNDSGVTVASGDSFSELQRHADSLQRALLEQTRLNAELQEQLRVAKAAAPPSASTSDVGTNGLLSGVNAISADSLDEDSKEDPDSLEDFSKTVLDEKMFKVMLNCLTAAESAVASLAAHCANADLSSPINLDLQASLDTLQKSLQDKEQLTQSTSCSSVTGTVGQKLHQDLWLLYKLFSDHTRRISDLQASLQEERGHKKQDGALGTPQGAKGLPLNVQVQLEALHKALREKKKTCKTLEEKLAAALTASPETARKAPEQGDKAVQVDFQDLGYETAVKSENDREESSSTDLEVAVNPSCSASSLPLLKHNTFSSTENLDSSSSTPYPSSPALSSAKVSQKGFQVFEDYGASEDPLQLQAQIRDLKVQLENQSKLILQMQSLLRRNSLSSISPAASICDPFTTREPEGTFKVERSQEGNCRGGQPKGKQGEGQSKNKSSLPGKDLDGEKVQDRSMSELQHARSRSTSPARLDSLVQSQARELSQLRQQIKESRRLGALHRQQLEELNKAFKELLHAGEVDCHMGEVVKEQLDKSLTILGRLEGRLDKGETPVDEDVAALQLSRKLAKELQEKNQLIHNLQNQIRGRSPSSHHSSHSDICLSDGTASSCRSSLTAQGHQHHAEWTAAASSLGGGASEEGVSGHRDAGSRVQGLRRENGRLQEQLRSSEELNSTLRSELNLHRSIMAQTSCHHQDRDRVSEPQEVHRRDITSQRRGGADEPRTMNPDLLAEHLLEIRALRQRLEESIRTNDRLREQLERRLAEVEKDPATNIFIHGNEEQGQLANEVQFLWGQNQALKEQLNVGSRDKQKENEKLRETLARRSAKLEQSRLECETLRLENSRLQERLEHSSQEKSLLQDSLHASKEQLHRLQNEVKLQRQQLSDSQHLLQSLRVELKVYEKMKTDLSKHGDSEEPTQAPVSDPSSSSLDLRELLSEIRHLRLQLERSIQTNTALRQKLEEQLLQAPSRSETININYLLSSPDERSRSPDREGYDLHHHSFQSHKRTTVHDVKQRAHSDCSASSSSSDGVSGRPSRLVPGHRMWANRSGRHVLGLIEDYNALRKQISEGRQLSRSMDAQLQECLHTLKQQNPDKEQMKSLCSSTNTMQQVLDEAGRLLKLLWRVSLPAAFPTGESSSNQQDELLKTEIARLKSRLSQQERMLIGAVKRLRTTNQLKEGMERVIIDQLSLTHGVLKKARGNLEMNYSSLLGLSGAADEGDPSQWTVDPPPADGLSEDHNSNSSLHCTY